MVQNLFSLDLEINEITSESSKMRGSTLQKPRTHFGETQRIPKNPKGLRQNPTETRESPWSWLQKIHKNPLESLEIPRNPQESWETSGILHDHFWKPHTNVLKCWAPRSKIIAKQKLVFSCDVCQMPNEVFRFSSIFRRFFGLTPKFGAVLRFREP